MPDVFVPLDTTQLTALHLQLISHSLIINATLRYVDEHRKEIKARYTTFDDYFRNFQVPQSMIDGIFAEAEHQKLKPYSKEECDKTLPMLKVQLKGLIARDIWDMNEYYRIMNEQNRIVQKAVEIATK